MTPDKRTGKTLWVLWGEMGARRFRTTGKKKNIKRSSNGAEPTRRKTPAHLASGTENLSGLKTEFGREGWDKKDLKCG